MSSILCSIISLATSLTCGCSAMRLADVSARDLDVALRAEKPKGIRGLDLAMLGRPDATEERLEAGDTVEVTISDLLQENQNHSIAARVAEDGTLSLPMVGSANVRGLTVTQSERAIADAYASKGYLRNPRLLVTVKERRPNRVFVIGGVKSPGVYQLPRSESDLLAAVIAAGGLSEDAGTTVEIRRRNPPPAFQLTSVKTPSTVQANITGVRSKSQVVDVWSAPRRNNGAVTPASHNQPAAPIVTTQPTPTPQSPGAHIIRYDLSLQEGVQAIAEGIAIQNGDIIIVEQHKQSPIYVLGSVRSPGVYSLPHDRELRVLEAIGGAGGINLNTTPNKALVLRHHPDGQAVTVVKVDLNVAKKDLDENIILTPGDTVSVEETPASFMRGIVRNAFRVGVGVGAQYNALGPQGGPVPF